MDDRLSSRYRIVRFVKRGGAAEIWEATAVEGGVERRVAIKRLLAETQSDPSYINGFFDEARIVSQLTHANIVTLLDFGVIDDAPFQVLELIDGLDLEALRGKAQSIPEPLALHIVAQVGHALAYAHGARDRQGRSLGIVHRDVSPENVLVAFNGDVKLADFGIALASERLEATLEGIVKGKLAYMAPEQMLRGEVDPRSDVFGLGCVLHWLLTGVSPMQDPRARKSACARNDPPLHPGLPKDVSTIIRRATRADPHHRHRSAAEMVAELGEALHARGVQDARSELADFMPRFRPPPPSSPAARIDALLDVECLLKEETDGDRRFFETVGPFDWSTAGSEVFGDETERPDPEPHEEMRDWSSETESTANDTESTAPSMTSGPDESSSETIVVERQGDPMIGQVLHSYRIEQLLGRGASARVYRASHLVLKREYAVKVMIPGSKLDETMPERMRREAERLSAIHHPCIVQVDDFGTAPNGLPFLTMELVRGQTLSEVVAAGPLELHDALRIARDVASGLGAAHRGGLIHRDLKPSNVMVTADGQVKILDFGIARDLSSGPGLTRSDIIMGTPQYMSPEQISGAILATPKSDLYSLGCLLYCMIAGQPPFTGDLVDVMDKQVSEPPPPLPAPLEVAQLVGRLLAKAPEERPPDADGVAAELQMLIDPRLPLATGAPPAPAPRMRARLFAPVLFVVAVLLGMGAFALLRPGPAPTAVRLEELGREPGPLLRPSAVPRRAESDPVPPPAPPPPTKKGPPPRGVRAAERPTPAPEAPPRSPADELRPRLGALGLTVEDVALEGSLDLGSIRSAADVEGVMEAVKKGAAEGRFVRARYQRNKASLREALGVIPDRELAALEKRNLDLRERVRAGMTPAERRRLLRDLGRLGRQISAARSR